MFWRKGELVIPFWATVAGVFTTIAVFCYIICCKRRSEAVGLGPTADGSDYNAANAHADPAAGFTFSGKPDRPAAYAFVPAASGCPGELELAEARFYPNPYALL